MEKFKTVTFDVPAVQAQVLSYAKKLWAERTNLNSVVLATHDTYLKMYQLSKPVLGGYDVLYVDEFQDTTPCVLDIVMHQTGPHEDRHGGRCPPSHLRLAWCHQRDEDGGCPYPSTDEELSATVKPLLTLPPVLQGAMKIEGNENIKSKVGFENKVDRSLPHTRLFRTNSALLIAAIAEIAEGHEDQHRNRREGLREAAAIRCALRWK
jgi:hypothetical protein